MRKAVGILTLLLFGSAVWYHGRNVGTKPGERFQPLPPVATSNRHLSSSEYPVPVDPALIGTYPAMTKSGAGYFYDEVLEYRVWIDPQSGGEPLNEGNDYFRAFATFEQALDYSKATKGAEPPLVLVRQLEHVNEPAEGVFEHITAERITEWQPAWLEGSKRTPDSIAAFISKHSKKSFSK